jgi:hypothetical protein
MDKLNRRIADKLLVAHDIILSAEETNNILHWFDTLLNTNFNHLRKDDYTLVKKLYQELGKAIPLCLTKNYDRDN